VKLNNFNRFWERKKWQLFGSRRKTLATFATAASLLFGLVAAAILGVGILFAWYAKDLPQPDKVKRSEGLSTVVLDRNNVNLYDIFEKENRIAVIWEDIPQYLKNATVAVEDKGFYQHQGLSTTGIFRALINIFIYRNFQGGSTLTQQLVKTVLLSQERTIPRKMKEAILAIQIERKYTKDEILHMYLNEVPYGGTAVGVESASQSYFGKPVKNLGLIECAFLAGLPQSPSRYSPFTSTEKAYIWRTEQVLRRMREDNYISATQENEAKKQLANLTFFDQSTKLKAPHFVAYVKELLIGKFGQKLVDAGGLKVTTSLDWKLQEKAQLIVAEEIEKAKKLKVSNGSAVVIDPNTGEILAMVGSRDYQASDSGGFKFNVATQGLRQPGSALKPITYAAALKKGYTASTVLLDVDTKYPSGSTDKPEYNPKNYDGKFRGPMQLRYALANSINTIAVKISALVGIKDILKTASDMGLTTLEPTDENIKRFGLSLTLGGGEVKLLDLTSAFGVFSTNGLKHEPIAILKVEDAKGKVIYEYKPTSGNRVLPADVSFIISNILSDNDARKIVFGEKSYLYIPGKTVAVKTGTTDDKRDNWTVGYTKSVVVGVWVGNNDNSPMNPALASGVTGAAPIWNRIIREALIDKKDEPFDKPDNIIEVEIDAFGGGLPTGDNPKRKEFYIQGTEPTGPASIYKEFKISKKDGNKLANEVEIARGEYDTKTFVVINENDPVSTDGKNRWQEAIDAWVNAQGDSKYHPPRDKYTEGDQVQAKIKAPGDHARVDTNNVEVRVEGYSFNDIKKIEIYVDGSKVKETSDKYVTETFNISNGQHTIRAVVTDVKGNVSDSEAHIGVNEPYTTPVPAPTATSIPAPTNSPSPTPTP
jgi:1A family penicillin-binding protein